MKNVAISKLGVAVVSVFALLLGACSSSSGGKNQDGDIQKTDVVSDVGVDIAEDLVSRDEAGVDVVLPDAVPVDNVVDPDVVDPDVVGPDVVDPDVVDPDVVDPDIIDPPVEMSMSLQPCEEPEEGRGNVTGRVMHHWAVKFSEGEIRIGDLVGGLNPQGFFYVCNAPAGEALSIHVRFPLKMMWDYPDGVAPISKRVVPVAGSTEFRVFNVKWSTFTPLTSADVAAGAVAVDGDTKVSFGPGAFVRPDGTVYEGEAFVQITSFDASNADDLESFPGDFLGVDNEEGDGSETPIVSFGFVDVNLMDPDFQPLALADGNPALLEFPVQNLLGDETTIPMWYYDVVSGLWIREGEGTVDHGTGMITAWVKHFTTWNADKPVTDTDCVKGVVTDGNGTPIPGAFMQGIGQGSGVSNAQGEFCVNFYPGATFALSGFVYSDGAYYESVEPKLIHSGIRPGGQTCDSPEACDTLADPVVLRRMDLDSYCLNVFLQDENGEPYVTDKEVVVNDASMDWQVIYMGAVNGSSVCVPVPAGHQVDVMVGGEEWSPDGQHCYCHAILFNEVDISESWDPLQISEGSASCGSPACDTVVLECECFSRWDM